jgi:GT2 family glycosyltransferase
VDQPYQGEMGSSSMVKVTVIIKALNEERYIASSIKSSLEAIKTFGGEVILADSGSTDRTIEIAMQFPIVVVQLDDPKEASCGIGPQLGFQHSCGEYVYILDGDMTLNPVFLSNAISFLDSEPGVAGVGGLVREMQLNNLEFEGRSLRHTKRIKPGEIGRLDMGGLYRRSAIDEVGYLSDRNLHGAEEYELALRLRAKGWRLVRLNQPSIEHYGHQVSTYRLLWRRLKSKQAFGLGELMRAAYEAGNLRRVMAEYFQIYFPLYGLLSWLGIVTTLIWAPSVLWGIIIVLLIIALPTIAMTVRLLSFQSAMYSVVTWHLLALGFVLGLFRRRRPPTQLIRSNVLRQPIAQRRGSCAGDRVFVGRP